MRVRLPWFFLVFALPAFSVLKAQQEQRPTVIPPESAALILRDLEIREKQQKDTMVNVWRDLLAKIHAGTDQGMAAANLYQRALEETKYEGKTKGSAIYDMWLEKNGDALRSKEMQAILLLHLKYLELSLQRADTEKPELFVTPSLAYARELAENDILFLKQEREEEKLKLTKERGFKNSEREKETQDIIQKVTAFRKELLDKSLTDSVFTKWLHLEQWLPKKDWELNPGNLSGILSKNVRPFMLKAKDSRIGETWIFEMQFLADRVVFSKLKHEAVTFDTVTRPKMQFDRANNLIEIGDVKGGVDELYGIIKTYPTHEDFKKWVERLRELLKPSSPDDPVVTPTPSGTSAQ